jgi:ATP-dependent RNA helicase RhlE
VTALPHVLNFDVPNQPDDYIHRVGRTARASMTGHAITFAAPEDGKELQAIERAVGKRLPRRQLAGFDYAGPAPKLEIPIQERIAAIRARKAEERARARAKAEAKAARAAARAVGHRAGGPSPRPSASSAAHPGRPSSRPAHTGGPAGGGGSAHRPTHAPARSGHGGTARPAVAAGGLNPWPGRNSARRQDARRAPRRPGR